MRIAFVNRGLGIYRGGGENADLNYARALRDLGHHVEFVAGRRMTGLDHSLDEFPVTWVRSPYLRGVHYRLTESSMAPLRRAASVAQRIDLETFERLVLALVRRPRFRGVDIFQSSSLPRLAAAIARAGRKSVLFLAGPPPASYRARLLECSAVFGDGDAYQVARDLVGERVNEIRIGVDSELFRPRQRSGFWQSRGAPDAAIVVFFAGRLVPIKDLPTLVGAFARAAAEEPRLHLALAGDGEMRASLHALAVRLGIERRVIFAGRLEMPELASAYAESDLLALTSTYENFPNTILEAFASGLAVVATRIGGIPLQVTDGVNGLLVPGGDIGAVAAAIGRLAGDEELRLRMGRTNRELAVHQYSWATSARKLEALYSSLM